MSKERQIRTPKKLLTALNHHFALSQKDVYLTLEFTTLKTIKNENDGRR